MHLLFSLKSRYISHIEGLQNKGVSFGGGETKEAVNYRMESCWNENHQDSKKKTLNSKNF